MQLPEHCITIRNYAEYRDEIQRFAQGKYNFILCIGNSGTGKTATVKEMLDELDESHIELSGRPSPFGFYQRCHDYADNIIILDDVATPFYRDGHAIGLLKNLTETRKVKKLHWPTASAGPGKEYPSSFETTSRVIILTNGWESISEHVRAIEGRAFSIHFDPTPTEVHLHVGKWFTDQEVYDFVWQYRRFITKPNMRLYVKISEQRKAGAPWQKRGLEMLIGDSRLNALAEILLDAKYKNNNQRIKAFTESGYGSRSTFYNMLNEFRFYTTETDLADCPKLKGK